MMLRKSSLSSLGLFAMFWLAPASVALGQEMKWPRSLWVGARSSSPP
jgi:hypothetical protein